MKERILYMDTLRGLAVILMVQQHLQTWLWNVKWMSYPVTWPKYPLMLTMHFTGWFAAPLFVLLAGAGSAIMHESNRPSAEFVKRGLMILLCGYLLNPMTPNWFRPGSWYVLHTIGIAIIISPLLLKIKNRYLVLIVLFSIILPAFFQTWLKTSLMPGNLDMSNTSLPGGIARIAFIEGHFPFFPWIGFFIAGILSRRMIKENRNNMVLLASFLAISAGIYLESLYNHGYFFATGGKFFRLFVPLPYFYPPLPPFIFFIMGIALLILYIFSKNYNFFNRAMFSSFNALGRSSLSWFMFHILVFNQLSSILGFYRIFNNIETILITFIIIVLMIFLSIKWQRYNFKYGIEWLIRKFTAVKA